MFPAINPISKSCKGKTLFTNIALKKLTEFKWVSNQTLSDQNNINLLEKKRRLNFQKMDKIFHDLEYVPLFGDMQISPFNYVKKTKNFDASKWPLAVAASSSNFSSSNQSPQANLQVRGIGLGLIVLPITSSDLTH